MSTIVTGNKKRYNNYTLSVLFSTLVGIAIIVPALLMHGLDVGLLPEWVIDAVYFVFGVSFVSRLVSGSSYVFSLLDRLTNEVTPIDFILSKFKKKKPIKSENIKVDKPSVPTSKIAVIQKNFNAHRGQFVGNSIGFIFGTILSVITLILRAVTPAIINNVISSAFYLINHISNFSGLFNRLGRVADYFHKSPKKNKDRFCRKNVNYAIGVILGAIAGAILIAVILSVAGITSAMTLGGAVPMWLSIGLLVIGTISSGASAGGYVGRCIDFLIGKRTVVHAVADTVTKAPQTASWRDRLNCEYSGTVIGVTVGIILATVLIAAGVASLPFFGLGLPKLFAGMILMAACVSQCGGLGNRLGNMLDKFFDTRKPHKKEQRNDSEKNDVTTTPNSSSAPDASCRKIVAATVYTRLEDAEIPGEMKIISGVKKTEPYADTDMCNETTAMMPAKPLVNVNVPFPCITCTQPNEKIEVSVKEVRQINTEKFSVKEVTKMGIFNKPNIPIPPLPQFKNTDKEQSHLFSYSAAAAA